MNVDNEGAIQTDGNLSKGVFAQSVGGGGGNGGFSVAGGFSTSGGGEASSVGGSGAGGGNGGEVSASPTATRPRS